MKRILTVVFLVALAGLQFLPAQSLTENQYYKRSLELHALATQSFDSGDYDAAADYAAQAQEYASLSDKYVEKLVAKSAADSSIATARKALAQAEADKAQLGWPEQYGTAKGAYDAALAAYAAEDYAAAKAKADEAGLALSDLRATMLAAFAKRDADKALADSAIAAAKARLAWADSIGAKKNWPEPYGTATKEYDTALASYNKEAYPEAKTHADAVLAALAAVTDKLPFPAVYVVRLIPERRDCLWRIAEYSFIYNNPLKWPVIYEANKKTFRDPNNPNLIYPGQVLQIPAINGELRAGTYDPAKSYEIFPKKK